MKFCFEDVVETSVMAQQILIWMLSFKITAFFNFQNQVHVNILTLFSCFFLFFSSQVCTPPAVVPSFDSGEEKKTGETTPHKETALAIFTRK